MDIWSILGISPAMALCGAIAGLVVAGLLGLRASRRAGTRRVDLKL
jgi:hypothetical protein